MKIRPVKQSDKNGHKPIKNCMTKSHLDIIHPPHRGIASVRRAPVAQWIEQRFPKPRVVRSTRTRGTTIPVLSCIY